MNSIKSGRLRRLSLPLACLSFILAATPVNAETPESALYSVLSKLKVSPDVSPLVELVDWEGTYSKMKEDSNGSIAYSSPEEMKAFYLKRAKDNGEQNIELSRLFLSNKELSSQQKKESKETTALLEKNLKDIQAKSREMLAKTDFIIEDVTLDGGNKAQVKLKKRFGDKESSLSLTMHKVNQKWVTEKAGIFNPNGSQGSPIGAFPDPEPSSTMR